MANLSEMNRAERRRAAREAAAEKAAKQMQIDAQRSPNDKSTLEKQIDDSVRPGKPVADLTPRKPMTKKELKKQAAEAAAAQLAKEAQQTPKPAPDNYRPGDTIPLHVLNQRAAEIDAANRDEATEIARKVGLTTRELIIGRSPRTVGSRSRRRNEAMVEQARILASQKKD